GRAARREALLRWSPHLQGRRYLEILERGRRQVADGGAPARAGRGTAWRPGGLDGPLELFVLEAYGAPAWLRNRTQRLLARARRLVTRGRRRMAHWRRRAARAAWIWREQGPAAFGRKVWDFVRYRGGSPPGGQP